MKKKAPAENMYVPTVFCNFKPGALSANVCRTHTGQKWKRSMRVLDCRTQLTAKLLCANHGTSTLYQIKAYKRLERAG